MLFKGYLHFNRDYFIIRVHSLFFSPQNIKIPSKNVTLSKVCMQFNIYHNDVWFLKFVWKFPKIPQTKVVIQTCHYGFFCSLFFFVKHTYMVFSYVWGGGVAVEGIGFIRSLTSEVDENSVYCYLSLLGISWGSMYFYKIWLLNYNT